MSDLLSPVLQLFAGSPALFIGTVFAVALLVGSFLNVVIHRLPIMMDREWREECAEIAEQPAADLPEGRFDLIAPRSRCPSCGKQITALQNIPVLSFILLGGRCANCKTKISRRYPAIEVITAVLTAAVAWRFGFGWEAAAAMFMTWSLVALTVIDIDRQLIPDSISLTLLWAGLAMSLFGPLPGGSEVLFIEPTAAIVGAIAGYLSLWIFFHAYRLLTGKEGFGYGDFKLLAAFGAWFGWEMLLPLILLSAVVGAVVGICLVVFVRHDRNVPIPFGPYLAGAGWIMMMYGPQIMGRFFPSFL